MQLVFFKYPKMLETNKKRIFLTKKAQTKQSPGWAVSPKDPVGLDKPQENCRWENCGKLFLFSEMSDFEFDEFFPPVLRKFRTCEPKISRLDPARTNFTILIWGVLRCHPPMHNLKKEVCPKYRRSEEISYADISQLWVWEAVCREANAQKWRKKDTKVRSARMTAFSNPSTCDRRDAVFMGVPRVTCGKEWRGGQSQHQ